MHPYQQLVRHRGNQDLFQAIEMSISALVNRHPFHIHAEGLRGTGKTTIMRAAAQIMPPIKRIKGCIYNCQPDRPHCPEHRHLDQSAIHAIGTEYVPRPFIEISHSAKIGTVVGSIDLVKLTDRNDPVAAFLPGSIPQAHRGIIFIDEINRLADTAPELADVLLDVMGTKPGRIQLEETGLNSVEFPVEVTVWAASNPDEEPGALTQIRRQLADRFDMAINMGRPDSYQDVISILSKKIQPIGDSSPQTFQFGSMGALSIPDNIKQVLASVYVDFGLESLRSIEAMDTAAKLSALQAGRSSVTIGDITRITPMVLAHRVDNGTVTNILRYLESLDQVTVPTVREPASASINQQVSLPDGHETYKNSWLATMWASLKEKLGKRDTSSQAATQTNIQPPDNKNANSSPNRQGRAMSQSSSNIADPLETKIIAPPENAVPLTQLTVEQFVSGEDKKSDG